jgi:hypothetical protein
MMPDEILTKLFAISRMLQEHAAAVYLLDRERIELQRQLRTAERRPRDASVSDRMTDV